MRARSEPDARVSRAGTRQERVDNFSQRHFETCNLDQQNKIAFPNYKDVIMTQALASAFFKVIMRTKGFKSTLSRIFLFLELRYLRGSLISRENTLTFA